MSFSNLSHNILWSIETNSELKPYSELVVLYVNRWYCVRLPASTLTNFWTRLFVVFV